MDVSKYSPNIFGQAKKTIGTHSYVAFFPSPIPRTIDLPSDIVKLLSEAEASLGRLSGVGQILPNPHLLIRPYLLREALASTLIEGTQASLAQMFEFEAVGGTPSADIEEVLNYIHALEWGTERMRELPICVRLVLEMHERVLAGVRGRARRPGEIRTTQNWIGDGYTTIKDATFVPPPPDELSELLSDWEQFANEETSIPLLIQNALLHYQFETIHPFLDGNGRLGRLLIIFFLMYRNRLSAPLLYVSSYFERDRKRYYESLQTVRQEGNIYPWLQLFLEAVQSQSDDAVYRANRIIQLREEYRTAASNVSSINAVSLVDLICETPILSARLVEKRLSVTRPTAIALMRKMVKLGVLTQETAGSRSQLRFVARELMEALGRNQTPQ